MNGRPLAQRTALQPPRRRWLPRAELTARLRRVHADLGLRDDLARLAGESTDDLRPLR